MCEELIKKAAELTYENENLRREKYWALMCYECGEPGHFARECRNHGGTWRHRSRSRSRSPRYKRIPSYERRSYSPHARSPPPPRHRSTSPPPARCHSYSRSPPLYSGREEQSRR